MTDPTFCEWCERDLPVGCRQLSGADKQCPLGPRTDPAWKVGKALWDDLNDRAGIKHELRACDERIQVQIIETLGKIAMREVAKLK